MIEALTEAAFYVALFLIFGMLGRRKRPMARFVKHRRRQNGHRCLRPIRWTDW